MKNMKKPVVLLDIDETVVENLEDWKEWYRSKTGQELLMKSNENIEDALINHKLDPLEYWKQTDLYDNKLPIKEALKVITKYRESFEFIFVSNCFSEHIDSKKAFISKWFGDFPFIDTNNKEYIKCDIAIDDRAYYLRNIKEKQPNTECIQIKTIINSIHDDFMYFDWYDINIYLGQRNNT